MSQSFNTYTPATGLTQPAMGLQSLNSALAALTPNSIASNPLGVSQQANQLASAAIANYPQYAQQQQVGLTNAAQLPQATGGYQIDFNTFKQMFGADQQLASKYMAQNPGVSQSDQTALASMFGANTPSANAASSPNAYTSPLGVVFGNPPLTAQNVNQPFQGFTDPTGAMALAGLGAQGLTGSAGNILSLIANNLQKMQDQYAINTGEYSNNVQALQNLSNYGLNLASFEQNQALSPYGISQALQSDATKGTSLQDLLNKYSGLADPTAILSIYKRNNPKAQNYTKQQLLSMGFTEQELKAGLPTLSSADEQKAQTLRSTLDTLNNLQDTLTSDTSLRNIVGNPGAVATLNYLAGLPGGMAIAQKVLGLSDNAVTALTDFVRLQGQGDRDMIGGRLSGYMLNVFGKSFPSISQSISGNGALINNLRQRLVQGANVYSQNQGFGDYTNLPGFEDYQDPTIANASSAGDWEVVK